MLKLFLVLLFVPFLLSSRVKIEVYAESYCPDCEQFLTGAFKDAFNTKDIEKIAEFSVVPYGNAKEIQTQTGFEYQCQHGELECQGNTIELCALNQSLTSGLSFIICLESLLPTTSLLPATQTCASSSSLSYDQIINCSNSQLGLTLLHEAAQKTPTEHQYVPWLVINEAHNADEESSALENLIGFICQKYDGTEKIEACAGNAFRGGKGFLEKSGKCWREIVE